MIINPIIPVWIMGIICVLFLCMKRKGVANYIRQIIVVVLLFIINLRIMVGDGETPTVTADVDVLFVVDNTISMLAEDYDHDARRLDGVKADCQYIMEELEGASFSVVSFGNNVRTLLPYTIDRNNVIQALKALNGETTLYATGTSFNDVMSGMKDILNNDRDNYQIVFFISDGEITTKEKLKSFPDLDKYVDDGAVMGYGTTKGGAMKVGAFTGDDSTDYLTYFDDDFEEQKSLSKIDEGNLKKVASDMGVSYVHMKKQSKIDSVLARVQKEIKASTSEKKSDVTDGYVDIYYIFVIPLVVLLIYDYIYYKRKL